MIVCRVMYRESNRYWESSEIDKQLCDTFMCVFLNSSKLVYYIIYCNSLYTNEVYMAHHIVNTLCHGDFIKTCVIVAVIKSPRLNKKRNVTSRHGYRFQFRWC